MDVSTLHNKINIILDEEVRSYTARGRRMGALGSMNIGLQSVPNNGWTSEGQIPQILFDKSDPNVISSPNATTLLKFFSTLDNDEKGRFKTYFISNLRKDSLYASIGYFIFFVLYRIGETVGGLKNARRALSGDSNHGYSNLLGMLSMIVSREYLEINPDRDRVIEIWGKKFSNIEVPSLISEIEDYFRDGDFTETKFATCIGRIRVLLVEVAKKIALGMAEKKTDTSISTTFSNI